MILDGRRIADSIIDTIEKRVRKIEGRPPTLAFILVGSHPASLSYVKNKRAACARSGITSHVLELPETVTEAQLIIEISHLGAWNEIDGILVQLPLPPHIQTERILEAIPSSKDVDGFHPENLGKLLAGYEGGLIPCTPRGIIEILKAYGIQTKGKHVVVVGRSNIVGKPTAALFALDREYGNATVTICHRHSQDLSSITTSADILIAAIGSPHFFGPEMIKEGAVVIDVGINRLHGSLVGDVDFEAVKNKCSAITPVPGGVGPMTIAMLLENTLQAFLARN